MIGLFPDLFRRESFRGRGVAADRRVGRLRRLVESALNPAGQVEGGRGLRRAAGGAVDAPVSSVAWKTASRHLHPCPVRRARQRSLRARSVWAGRGWRIGGARARSARGVVMSRRTCSAATDSRRSPPRPVVPAGRSRSAVRCSPATSHPRARRRPARDGWPSQGGSTSESGLLWCRAASIRRRWPRGRGGRHCSTRMTRWPRRNLRWPD